MRSRVAKDLPLGGLGFTSPVVFTARNCAPDSCRTGDSLFSFEGAFCSISPILVGFRLRGGARVSSAGSGKTVIVWMRRWVAGSVNCALRIGQHRSANRHYVMIDKLIAFLGRAREDNVVSLGYEAAMGSTTEQAPRVRGRPRSFQQDAVLDRAMTLFWRQGYEPTSMSDLSRATGLNAPSIYAAFGNKERLFLRVLDHYVKTRKAAIEQILETAPTAREAMRELLMKAARRYTSPEHPPGCLVALAATGASPEARMIQKTVRHRRRIREEMLRARIQKGIDAGELPHGTRAGPLAKFFSTVFHGMALQAADGASRAELEAVAKEAMAAWPA